MTQEVSWPPPQSQAEEKNNYLKTLPNPNEKVHIGRSQRQKMDLELDDSLHKTHTYCSYTPLILFI